MIKISLFLLLATLLLSCNKEAVAPSKLSQPTYHAEGLHINVSVNCGLYTQIQPKVDVLFVWDNSPSSLLMNEDTKASLRKTIGLISQAFDYHIVIAPLYQVNP